MLKILKTAGLAGGLALCLVAAQPAAAAWTVTAFDRPGASSTQLWGINDAGQFVGSDSLGGYVVDAGVATGLGGPVGAVRTVPFGISNAGLVVGSWYDASATERGFLYAAGQYTSFDLPLAGVTRTEIRHVSLDGRWLTGLYNDSTGQQQGFVYDLGTSVLQLPTVPGAFTFMQGANSAGLTVGSQSPGGGVVFDALTGNLQAVSSVAGFAGAPRFRGINNAGLISGYVGQRAIVGTLAGGFTALPVDGAATAFGEGLNNVGQLVGNFTDASGLTHGFIASSVPEPATAAIWLAGLSLLGGWHLRRQASERRPLHIPTEVTPS